MFYLQTFVISLLLAVNEVRYTLLRFLLIYSIILNQGIVVNSLFYVYKGMIFPISQILECTLLMLFVSIEDILCKGQIIIETHSVSIFFFNLRSLAIEKTKLPNFFTPFGNFCSAFHVKKR